MFKKAAYLDLAHHFYRATELQSYRATELQSYRATELQSYRINCFFVVLLYSYTHALVYHAYFLITKIKRYE